MLNDDLIRPFQIDAHALRGRLVRLGPAIDTVLGRHDYPEPVAVMLGEMVALTAAFSAALKFEGVLSLQTKGDGPISFMVADLTSDGEMRGYAKFDDERLGAALATPGPGRPEGGPLGDSVPRLLGAGHLAFTVDQGEHTERYQGIVELNGPTLVECMQHYFRQSEQLEAGLRLAAGRVGDGEGAWRAGAIMLQRLPDADRGFPEQEEEGWRRALILLGSSTDEELLSPDLDPDQLLFRLFHEDGVRVYRPKPLSVGCRCSRKRVETVLRAMPREDLEDLKVDGQLVVTCEFCNRSFRFDATAMRTIYET